jgi:6-phosphogluconate dehydrogenase (decarboxylating)
VAYQTGKKAAQKLSTTGLDVIEALIYSIDMEEKKKVWKQIAVREETYEEIRKIAYEEHKPITQVIHEMVEERLGK